MKSAGFKHALLMGMGGSSLCPEVMRMTFGKMAGYPEMHVLDSTDPAQIRAIEKQIDLANTIFIVSSKSGSTLEPNIYKQYFFERVKQMWARRRPVTASSRLPILVRRCNRWPRATSFRHMFFGVPSIGGRYSALSNFGMVPAAVIGVDMPKFLTRRRRWCMRAARRCRLRTIPAWFWARSWECWEITGATKSRSLHRPVFSISARGWSS